MKSTRFATCLGGILLVTILVVQAQDAPSGLLCNLLTQPEKCVITEPQPDFGWIVNSSQTADLQTAYRILVASSPVLLEKGTRRHVGLRQGRFRRNRSTCSTAASRSPRIHPTGGACAPGTRTASHPPSASRSASTPANSTAPTRSGPAKAAGSSWPMTRATRHGPSRTARPSPSTRIPPPASRKNPTAPGSLILAKPPSRHSN